MATGYEKVREEIKGWEIEDLMFGLRWELSLLGKKNFDEGIILVYLDAIEKKLPQTPLSEIYASYEQFRKKMFEKYGMELPPIGRGPGR